MTTLSMPDLLSAGWFLFAWFGFNVAIDLSPLHRQTLSYFMEDYRRSWMITMSQRPMRIMDTSIMSGLQQGTAFFASTALLAIGGCFGLLNSTDVFLRVANDLSLQVEVNRTLWEMKVLGLMLLFAYGFFKFGWAYRLFNYASIVMGTVPDAGRGDDEVRRTLALNAAELNVQAGRHFNQGQRTFFFTIGFLGWFAGPAAFAVMTLAVLLVLLRRQFGSKSRKAALAGHPMVQALIAEKSQSDAGQPEQVNPFA